MGQQSSANTRRGIVAIVAVALLAAAFTGCGVGGAGDKEKISKTATSYLRALAAGDTGKACVQLTPRGQAAGCASAVTERLSRLDSRALSRAADASMGIKVHGNAATATLAEPHGARLVLARVGHEWRINSGYTVPPAATTRRAAAVIAGGGRLIDVSGGHRLYIKCVGSGLPTVVLEAGFPGDSTVWRDVQPQLGRTTRTCAYDRSGLGHSLQIPGVRDASDEITDLQQLLHAAHLAPPYVLVGHSYGGLLVRLFAKLHRNETAGVVLVDARGRDATRRQQAIWPRSEVPAVRRDVFRRVQQGVDLAAGEALASRVRSLGQTPLVVITAGTHAADWGRLVPPRLARALDRLWATMQDELALLSTDHAHVVALRSDHLVQRRDGQPGVVIRAVDAVAHAARDHRPLPPCRQLFSGSRTQCRN
jgi:pimeloyl-ACP methyl ester carboxylesterase